jgi:hypothetical protein
MSLSTASRPAKAPATRTRKIVITLIVLVSLILVGTIVVLSSISYYLAIPAGAYLTEDEVPWRPEDVIRSLYDAPTPSATATPGKVKRQDFEEIGVGAGVSPSTGVMGTDTIAEVQWTMRTTTPLRFRKCHRRRGARTRTGCGESTERGPVAIG